MMNSANSGVMANLSLNLSRQSWDLLRYALCEQKQHQQQETEHILEMLGQSQANAHIPNSAGVLLSQLKSLHRPQAYIMNSQGAEHLIPNEHSVTKFAFKYVLKPMSALDANLDYYSSGFWQSSGDQRSSSLPFMSGGPWKLLFATMIYLYLVKSLLPRAMKRQSALELNWPLRAYNLLMIVSNIYAFYHGCRLLDFGRKCFGCEVINHQDYSHAEMELLNYGWLFLLSRLLEWLDTIFFVLRKKDSQVTKLHVFHHSFVPLICWTYLKYHPGKTVAFFPLVNTFVHSIMYSYYFLATFGRAIQPYLWWKKYLTSLQIAQFVLILIQLATIPLSSHEGCQYPRGFLYVAFAGAILFLWLFYTYYIETYKTVGSKQQIAMRNPTSKTPGDTASLHKKRQQALGREGTSSALSDAIEDAICSESSSFKHASMKLD